MFTGPDREGLARCAELTSIPVIASGGVGTIAHLQELSQVGALNGVIVGKAIYEGKFTVSEAVQVLS